MVEGLENTYCPNCDRVLIERRGFHIGRDDLSPNGGRCPDCATSIAGIWVDG